MEQSIKSARVHTESTPLPKAETRRGGLKQLISWQIKQCQGKANKGKADWLKQDKNCPQNWLFNRREERQFSQGLTKTSNWCQISTLHALPQSTLKTKKERKQGECLCTSSSAFGRDCPKLPFIFSNIALRPHNFLFLVIFYYSTILFTCFLITKRAEGLKRSQHTDIVSRDC